MTDPQIPDPESWREQLSHAALFGTVGLVIAIGQLLASQERLTPRIIVGRALATGGIAMGAGTILIWMPELSLVGQVGVAATLASLGTSGLEKLFQRWLGRS